jgi:hypothetical protein
MAVVVNRMMDLDVESLTGAAYDERSDVRTNQRDGYRERPWHATARCRRLWRPADAPGRRPGGTNRAFVQLDR